MIGRLLSVAALLSSFAILCFGHGLQSVLLPARGAMFQHYPNIVTGAMMSFFYIGFISGTLTCPRLIERVGHIRVFAAASAGAAVIMLLHALIPHPIVWVILRALYGFCLIHLYMVMESWLNSIGEPHTRGKILSIYMIVNFVAMSVGQLLFFLAPIGGFELFSISAIMLSLALLPLILSSSVQPVALPQQGRLGVKELFLLSPLGVIGASCVGLIGGAYWGLTAVFIIKMGFAQESVAMFMVASLIGGLMAQWPLGALSDRINRRWVILLATLVVCGSAVSLGFMPLWVMPEAFSGMCWLMVLGALFGAGFHPLYSLCIAHANDFITHNNFVRASAGLQFVQGIGAIIGPLFAGVFMYLGGYTALYFYIAMMAGGFVMYTLKRMFENRQPSKEMMAPFRFLTRMGVFSLAMDPRNRTSVSSETKAHTGR